MLVHPLSGVYAAAVTPIKENQTFDREAMPALLDFLARRGCHGALILGTTGEGPSFSPEERQAIWQAALEVRQDHPEFRLLAGTGTPSLTETSELNRAAFGMGFDGVVVLPPYYFRNASEEGLYVWFKKVIEMSVPNNGAVFAYHFPRVSGVPLSLNLLQRLKEDFPDQFLGIKDSSGELAHVQDLRQALGREFITLVGNDRIFSRALGAGASGCITALANLRSKDLRIVWDGFLEGIEKGEAQRSLTTARDVLERFPPTPAFVKAMLRTLHQIPRWELGPPLTALSSEDEARATREMMRAVIR